jgi:hypothetical protein
VTIPSGKFIVESELLCLGESLSVSVKHKYMEQIATQLGKLRYDINTASSTIQNSAYSNFVLCLNSAKTKENYITALNIICVSSDK